MLVLMQKVGDKINLYSGNTFLGSITTTRTFNGKAKLGFEFNDDIRIFRAEIDPHLEPHTPGGNEHEVSADLSAANQGNIATTGLHRPVGDVG